MKKKPTIAICYDFDGTLSPKNMQEFDFIPQLKMSKKTFWTEVHKKAKDNNADPIIIYMCEMLDKANSKGVKIDKKSFKSLGKTVDLFNGVDSWFNRINNYANENMVKIEHFIISSGIKEIIEGTKIAKEFNEIFACSFIYDQHDVAISPGLAIDYTSKTQFLFRINKGAHDISDSKKINKFIEPDLRPIPFTRMIYIGDGSTDIPCMKLVKELGGKSIAVYMPKSPKKRDSEQLLRDKRVNYIAPADYSEGKHIDKYIKAVILKMKAEFEVFKIESNPK